MSARCVRPAWTSVPWTSATSASAASAAPPRSAAGGAWTMPSAARCWNAARNGRGKAASWFDQGRPFHIGTELMPRIGTPLSPSATRVLLCGSGELGKEVVIELQRLGVEVIAVDRYADAPAMQVAHRSHVVDMLDGAALRAVIEREQPHYIVPEI